jgi:hypothetical protein
MRLGERPALEVCQLKRVASRVMTFLRCLFAATGYP